MLWGRLFLEATKIDKARLIHTVLLSSFRGSRPFRVFGKSQEFVPGEGRLRYPCFWSNFPNSIFAFKLSTKLMEGDISWFNDVIRQPEIQNPYSFLMKWAARQYLNNIFRFYGTFSGRTWIINRIPWWVNNIFCFVWFCCCWRCVRVTVKSMCFGQTSKFRHS